jgi:quercetin dioxygenase-like cupin family protein
MYDKKPIRRIVTGHDDQGNSVFRSDDAFTPDVNPAGDAGFSALWATERVPADNNDDREGRDIASGITLDGGSVIRLVDILPGRESPMHRTNSIDYGIVLEGEIELELDNGATKTIGAGGVIVQRGTIHLWRNKSADKVCRIIFVLIEAAPYIHNGKPIADVRPEDEVE